MISSPTATNLLKLFSIMFDYSGTGSYLSYSIQSLTQLIQLSWLFVCQGRVSCTPSQDVLDPYSKSHVQLQSHIFFTFLTLMVQNCLYWCSCSQCGQDGVLQGARAMSLSPLQHTTSCQSVSRSSPKGTDLTFLSAQTPSKTIYYTYIVSSALFEQLLSQLFVLHKIN